MNFVSEPGPGGLGVGSVSGPSLAFETQDFLWPIMGTTMLLSEPWKLLSLKTPFRPDNNGI